jgi:hypothetical protein
LVIGGASTPVEIDKIGIGGALASAQQDVSDRQADILPPAHIISPHLKSTLLVRHPETPAACHAKLAELVAEGEVLARHAVRSRLNPMGITGSPRPPVLTCGSVCRWQADPKG